ncbi:MAG: molybdopterin-dependent oxidoreductase, partial [Thermoanaerobaculia bacterium]|nr:molybdopterin-dependent oxidoreductase [Thermoanaerobaculia bacterium]
PGRNAVSLIADDQPFLVEREIRHAGEPILLLAHEDRERLLAARVEVDVEARPARLDPELSTEAFKRIELGRGDPEGALARAAHVVEGVYVTGSQEHAYLETQGVIAVPENGGVTIHGSMQCPFYVKKALATLLGHDRVRVVHVETGGGFGGKEEYPSIVAGHAALLALKSGRPVKLVYDRAEDMLATTKRHPSRIRVRSGVASDGELVALDVDLLLDGGAYVTLSPVVLSRAVLHATGAYRCENVRVRGRAVATDTVPTGAFRGFGAPQALFAAEVHMERVAAALGVDAAELRRRNAFRPGDRTATGQVLGDDCSALEVLAEGVARSGWGRRRDDGRALGLALTFHGSGFTGAGERHLASRATVELTPDGPRVLVSSTEFGQGTRTALAQIVAEALGVPYDDVEVEMADTARVPDSGPTVASRTVMVVGGLLQRCAEQLRARLAGATPADFVAAHGPLAVTCEYEPPPGTPWSDETYTGDAYAAFGWGCHVAEVAVDPDSHEVTLGRVVAVADVGRAVHPQMVAGQIEGGTAQGLGWALLEEVVMRDGAMANASLTHYIVPTAADTPPIEAVVVERPCAFGPYGAKGVGELPIDGAAPAVANGLRRLGYDVRELPMTPERLARCASS